MPKAGTERVSEPGSISPDVAELYSRKINGKRASDIAMQYQVDRWPTDVITDSQGRVLYKTVSPQDPNRYVQLLNAVSADFRSVGPPGPLPRMHRRRAARSWQSLRRLRQPDRSPIAIRPYSPPPARTAPVGSASSPAYGDGRWPSYGGTAPMPNNDAVGDPKWRPVQSYANQYAPNGPAQTGPQPGPTPREQLNPYAAPYVAAPAAGAGAQVNGYDPRSSWPSPGGAYGGPAYGSADPSMAPGEEVIRQTSRPRRTRFVSDRAAAESPRRRRPSGPARWSRGRAADHGRFLSCHSAEQERWVKGDPRWGAVHLGRTYLFLSQQHQQRFLADPDRYSPVLSGYDSTRYVDRGELVRDMPARMWFRGKIYLFADEEWLDRFSAAPEVYAQRAHEIMMAAGRN